MAWKHLGDNGFAARIDHAFDTAKALRDAVANRPGDESALVATELTRIVLGKFELVAEPTCTNVCFWFLPPSVRGADAPARDSEEWKKRVHNAPIVVKQKAQEQGLFMVKLVACVLR